MHSERIESCGKRITKALDIRGIKQVDLCKMTGIPKSSLSLYLKDAYEPKQDRIYKLAQTLGVSEAWLMGYDVPMERADWQKKNDQLAQLIALMRKDSEFANMVKKLSLLTPEQRESIKPILAAFAQQNLID